MAIFLHEQLARAVDSAYKTGLKRTRVLAARAMRLGGSSDEDAEKYIRTESKHNIVLKAAADYDLVMTTAGDRQDDADGRLAMLIRKDAHLEWNGATLRVNGRVWICQWGDGEATCEDVDLSFATSDANPGLGGYLAELRLGVEGGDKIDKQMFPLPA